MRGEPETEATNQDESRRAGARRSTTVKTRATEAAIARGGSQRRIEVARLVPKPVSIAFLSSRESGLGTSRSTSDWIPRQRSAGGAISFFKFAAADSN